MIDIENELFTYIKPFVPATFSAEFIREPASFPFVSMMVKDNTFVNPDSSGTEKFCRIMVEFNTYSNKKSGKKQECKKIANSIDEAMAAIGFQRIVYSPTPNIDETIFRLTTRYVGVVDTDKNIYRR